VALPLAFMSSAATAVMRRLERGSLFGARNAAPTRGSQYDARRIPAGSGAIEGFPYSPSWDSDRAVREGLKVCATLATCLGRIAERAASVPWYEWEEKRSGSPKRLDPVAWLEYPRQDGKVSRAGLMEEAHLHSSLNGNCLIGVLWEGGVRRIRPREIQVENPQGCRPVPDRLRYISAYEWDDRTAFGPMRWDADDIVHVIGRRDPANRYWGWSIVEALAYTIDADVEARRLNLRQFRRGGTPSTIIVDQTIKDDDERAEVEESLNRSAQKRYGAFLVLGGQQDVKPQNSLTSRQLGLVEAMAFHRSEIAVACDLLPAMFDPQAATYDNMAQAIRHEWRVAVLRNARFSDAFTTKLIPREMRGTRWYAPWYGDVEELQDLRRKIDDTAELVQKCRVAVNDAIEATGLPVRKQPGGDVALVEANLIPAPDAALSLGGG
jgi:phage portal protein BeeE